jgi:GNAT superfamily N-acetyltransferase
MCEAPQRKIAEQRRSIRSPQRGDFARMAELAGQLGYPCTQNEVQARVEAIQRSRQHAVYVAEDPAGQIIGWIGVYVFYSVELAPFAEINGLIVNEDNRSCGVGKLLLDAAEKWARSMGCEILSVRSNVIRKRAHQFYTNNGFELAKTQNEFRKRLKT